MKNLSSLWILFFAMLVFSSSNLFAQHKFVGVKKCGMCHKKDATGNQLKVWKSSKHSKAYKTLQTAESDKIAAEQGLKTKAAESPECLKCHVTAYGVDASKIDKKFKIEDGIQCESCHGAGSKYKSKKIMKNHAKSVANGLTEYKDEAAIKAQCITCHNEESPSHKPFKFEEMWAKIKHDVPNN